MPTPTLLIVDDEENITRSLARSLRDQFTVFTANAGQAALDILAREDIDVILTDQRMPGMTGVELLAQARSVSPDSISIIITAYTDVEALVAALNLGNVRGYVPKPWNIELLRQKLLEAALQQSDRFVQQVLDTTPDGIYVYNALDRHTVYVNQGATALLGYTSVALSQLAGVWLEQLAQPEDAEQIAAQLEHIAAAQDNEVVEIQCRVRHAAGDWRWVQSWERVLSRTAAGQPRLIVGTFQDITARQQLEDLQRQTTAQRIELIKLKDEFLSRIGHELRTPLTGILLSLELLETAQPEKRDRYMQRLKHGTERLRDMIEDILLFSQLNHYARPVTLELIDLNRLIEGQLTAWQALSTGHQLEFKLNLAQNLPRAPADGELLMQALNRVVVNAVNYTPTGQVTIATALVAEDDRRWITVSVRDTGPGITPEDLPRIFERFYRGRAAADYKTPGTGIGLSISQEIADKLGGRLTVETQPGVGSTFTIWLPDESDPSASQYYVAPE